MTNLEVLKRQNELIKMINKLKQKLNKKNKKPYTKTSLKNI